MKAYKMKLPKNIEERKKVSRSVQKHAFKIGWSWDKKSIKFIKKKYLFFDDNGKIRILFKESKDFFDESSGEEITPEDFLELPLPGVPRDFMADFTVGQHVVGEFRDIETELPALGVLFSIVTRQYRGGAETRQYSTSYRPYQLFTPIESFDSAADAEKYILGRLVEIQTPPR